MSNNPFKLFLPLIIAFSIIILYTVIALFFHGSWDLWYAMRQFEAAFFIIFAIMKLLNWKGFVNAYQTYDILAKHSKAYAYAYPLIELGLGLAYLTGFQLFITNLITVIIMVIGTIGVAQALHKKQKITCACLGVVFKVPMTTVTLVEDILMGVMALLMMFQ